MSLRPSLVQTYNYSFYLKRRHFKAPYLNSILPTDYSILHDKAVVLIHTVMLFQHINKFRSFNCVQIKAQLCECLLIYM